jgi:L-lysine 6-monooxygenase (NADPH-requiring)
VGTDSVRRFSCVGIGAGTANLSLAALTYLAQPTSQYSFLSYPHKSGRPYHCRNMQFDAVPRQDFRNYMEWACRKNENIMFDREVLPVEYSDVFYVHLRRERVTGDNIGIGIRPQVPPQALPYLCGRQFHGSDFLSKACNLVPWQVTVAPASSRRRSDNPGPDHDDGPLMLLEQHLWSIVVARGRKQGGTGVQDGAGGVHGAAGRVGGTASTCKTTTRPD